MHRHSLIADIAKIAVMIAMVVISSTVFVRWIDDSLASSERQAQEWRETHQPVFDNP